MIRPAIRRTAEVLFFLIASVSAGWLPVALAINLSPQDPETTLFGWFLIRSIFAVPLAMVIMALIWATRRDPESPSA